MGDFKFMRRKKDAISRWYVPWQELQDVVAAIRRADGEAEEDGLRQAKDAAREAEESE